MDPHAGDAPTERERVRRSVQIEAGAWGILKATNDAFINPLLLTSGAGALALGIYNSGANLFGFGSGWIGPRFAARVGNVGRANIVCIAAARLFLIALSGYLLLISDRSPVVIIALVFGWGIGEGLALPFWTSFLAGLVGPGQRGQWLAGRALAATVSTVPVMAAIVALFLLSSKERVLPVAYGAAAISAMISLAFVRRLFRIAPAPPVPPARSIRSFPHAPETRRFLGGVWLFWFGSALAWPVLPAYVIQHLGAPTIYFAVSQLIAAGAGIAVQRRWGKLGDEAGATRVLLLSGFGASIVPILWAVVPVFWLGFLIDMLAQSSWPGHMLGLMMRSVELAEGDGDRASVLGWTNLAQGAGACISPIIAAVLVTGLGTVPILIASGVLRLIGVLVMAETRRRYSPVPSVSRSSAA